MGTRSLTVVREDRNGKDIIVMYRQMDGYPSGMGKELAEFLAPFTITNGFNSEFAPAQAANGMSCLAAQIVARFKNGIGNIYLEPSGTRDLGEEYIYTVYQHKNKIQLMVQGGDVTFFGLPGTKQKNMPVLYDGPVEQFSAESAEEAHKKLRENIPNDVLDGQKKKRRRKKPASAA